MNINHKGGHYEWGQLGNGTFGSDTSKRTPIEITQNFNLQPEETIVEIAAGSKHTIAVTSTGRVFVWGLNDKGQLGDGTTTNSSIPVEVTIR